MSGTYRDLLFWSKSRYFERKNHRWGLRPMETGIKGANHTVLHAQNDRLCLGPMETCYSSPKVDVLLPKTRWGLGPIETSDSEANHAFLHPKKGRWVMVPIETCNSAPKVAVLGGKTKDKVLGPIETYISGANHAVVHAQNDRWYLGHIETCYDPKGTILHPKTTHEGWHP